MHSKHPTATERLMSCSVRWNSSAGWQHWSSPAAPKPRVNLTRFHGVFSPNSKLRGKVVPGKPAQDKPADKPRGYGQTWAQRLKRVFAIDIEKCEKCGGKLKVIASIEDPDVIEKILKHLGLDQASRPRSSLHNRSPPENMFEHTTTLF